MPIVAQYKRLLTAAIGLPVLVVVVLLGSWPLWIMLAAASLVGMEEYFAMVGRPPMGLRAAGLALGLVTVLGAALGGVGWILGALLAAVWLEQFDFLGRFARQGETRFPRGVVLSALAYVPASLGLLTRFSALEIFFVMAVVMAADTGAYYGGSLLGGPKVWPTVSPGKTVSGSCSGLVSGMLVAGVFGWASPVAAILPVAGLGVLLALVSQFGDFYESSLKRVAGIKDSGRLLPGHGGMLDRIDGLLPAIVVYAACRTLWGLAG